MKKKILWILVLVLCMSLLMSACGKAVDSEPAEESKTDIAESEETVVGTERSGVLRIATKQAYVILGVPMATTQAPDWLMGAPAIETLARLDENGNVTPWLAREVSMNEENRVIHIVLNEGIEFHDGTPFNAEAVKRNYEIAAEYGCTFTAEVESCEIISEYELNLHLNNVNSYTLLNVTVDGGRMISPTYFDENGYDDCVKFAVGTGPYKMEKPADDTQITYVANDHYWVEGMPYLEGIEWILCGDESTALTILQTGEANAISATTPDDAALLSKDENYVRVGGDNGYYSQGTQLVFETDDPESPMYDVRVRQAFCYALDRETIVEAESAGFRPAVQQLALSGITYSDQVNGYEYAPEKAKELLIEAGYADGCEITLNYIQGGSKLAVMMQAQLEEAGFVVNMNLMERSQWMESVLVDSASPFDDVIFSYIGYSVAHMSTAFGPTAINYSGQWDEEVLNQLNDYFDVMKNSMDSAEIQAATDSFQKLLIDEQCMVCPLNAYTTLLFAETSVEDMGFFENHVNLWTPEKVRIR